MNDTDLKRLFLAAVDSLNEGKPEEGPGSDAVHFIVESPVGEHPIIAQAVTSMTNSFKEMVSIFTTIRYSVESDEPEVPGKHLCITTSMVLGAFDPSKSLAEHDIQRQGSIQGPVATLVNTEDESKVIDRLAGGIQGSLRVAVERQPHEDQLSQLIAEALVKSGAEATPGCDCERCAAINAAKAGITKTGESSLDGPPVMADVSDTVH